MAFTLQADNRVLTQGAQYSFLSTNYASGVSSIVVLNSSEFSANDYILIESMGSETAEIILVSTVTAATHTLTLGSNTKFAHPESARVTIIPYNQVKFYWTSAATYDTDNPVTNYLNIEPSSFYTIGEDNTNSTGYGWFVFYNSTTAQTSTNSNYIPYADFNEDTVKNILDDFFGLLNDKDLKLISTNDAMAWLNEAYSKAQNALNLVNDEYFASTETTLSITGGTQEYSLADDFSSLIYVRPGTGDLASLIPIQLRDVPSFLNAPTHETRYYLRGKKIGFVPIPFEDTTYYYRYRSKQAEVTAYSDIVDLPQNGYYAIQDYMLGRAYQKLTNPNATSYLNMFDKWIQEIKMNSADRDDYPDRWQVDTRHWI